MSNSKNSLKSGHVLEIMNYIEDEYIESALKRLDYMGNKYARKKNVQKKPKMYFYTFAKRVAIFIGIVILATTTTVATAMAVNEDFRETVKEFIFEFLHIEEEETVPQLPGTEEVTIDTMYVEPDRSILGGVIEGRYVHTPVSCNAREGVYVICTDEIELNQGSHYDAYYEENGEFFQLEEHTFSGDYTVLGNEFHIAFDWAVHGGQVALTYVGAGENYRIPANPGDSDAMLVELLCSSQDTEGEYISTAYPVFLNLETGELTDVLAGTGAEKLMDLCNQAVSEDGSKMLLAQSDGSLYYVDLAAKALYSVEELSGEKADACSLIGDTLSCWTLENGKYQAWSIDLTTMERTELFSEVPNIMGENYAAVGQSSTDETDSEERHAGIVYLSGFDTIVHWGTMFTGSHFALETDEAGNVTVIELATGEKIPVEGFTWPADRYTDVLWESSPDGKRLLISGGEIGSKYEYIGVLDFEKMNYLEFSRKNSNEVYEWKPYWFDKDTVIIQAISKDSYDIQDYYVYDLLDESAVIIEGIVENVPTVVYQGKGYSIAVPEEGWVQCEEESWVAEVNEAVKLWITDYSGETVEAVREQLTCSGYVTSEEDPNFLMYTDEKGIVRNVALFAEGERVVGVSYCFPLEATEGFGSRLAKIVNSFTWEDAGSQSN